MSWLLAALIKLLVMAVAVWLTAKVVPGIKLKSAGAAVTVALVYGVLNVLFGRILWFFTFPLAIISLGIVVNAILLFATDKLLDDELEIQGFVPLFLGATVLGVLNWALRVALHV